MFLNEFETMDHIQVVCGFEGAQQFKYTVYVEMKKINSTAE